MIYQTILNKLYQNQFFFVKYAKADLRKKSHEKISLIF